MEYIHKIRKVLEKKHEKIILDMYLKNYYNSNSYYAIIYNEKIEKFKVLFVPIDLIDILTPIEEYFCYQFIFVHTVNYILNTIRDNEISINKNLIRSIPNNYINYIEINTHVASNNNKYTFNEFIDNDLDYLFEIIVILFEHSPNIVSELCKKLIIAYNNKYELYKHNEILNIDYLNNYNNLFDNKIINRNKYNFNDIDYIEKIGKKTYAIINNEKVEIEYNDNRKVLSIYSPKYNINSDEIYIITKGIINNYKKPFIRIKYNKDIILLCYGIENNIFKIFNRLNDKDITIKDLVNKKLKITNISNDIKKDIHNYLLDKYTKNKVKEIEDFTYN